MTEDIPVVHRLEDIGALPADATVVKGNDLTDHEVAGLVRCGGLTDVYLDGCMQLGDEALLHLGRLPKLQVLYITGGGITDDGLAHLAECAKLRELGLDAPISGAGFRHLSGLAKLHEIHLPACPQVTAAGLTSLGALPELRKLCFYNCKSMDDTWLAALSEVRTLFRLTLFNCPGVTDVGVETLTTMVPDCEVDRSRPR